MKDKVCLVTGATSGIGKETARVLAGMGATVILAGRSRDKAERTQEWIRETTGCTPGCLLADFASLDAVSGMAEVFKTRYDRLDVLINNAGAYYLRRGESQDGYELTFAVNHLAPFLLTNLLLDLLKSSAPSRIINVSSGAHIGATMDFDDLEFKRSYPGMGAYGRSKLANILFTYELARRLEASGYGDQVVVNAMHPGFVATNIGADNFPVLGTFVRWILNLSALPVEKGAETVVYLASAPEAGAVTGKYFIKKQAVRSAPASYDEAAAKRLWEISEQMVGID